MVFSSPVFLFVFFPLVFAGYFLTPARQLRLRNAWLIIASLFFYGFGEPRAMLLMLGTVVFSYGCALLIARGGKWKRIFLPVGVIGDLALLGVFKYADFFVGTVNGIFGTAIPLPGLALPIGISFFIFQAVSYLADVARGAVQVQRNFWHILLYISFFPQLIAGPIVRCQTVADALNARHSSAEDVSAGLKRMILGLSKKLLIADAVGLTADTVFARSADASMPLAWLGAVCCTLQIYFDFSGYSDMAVGMGRIFGFQFPENFRHPYTAASITEFWRRWHITLTDWFRQYLYIPLGGNRKGKGRTLLNKWIVFLCTGLWHGASWNFVIWGAINGALMTGEQLLRKKDSPKTPQKRSPWYMHLYTMAAVILAFVIFRADTLPQAGQMYKALFTGACFSKAAVSPFLQQLSPFMVTVLIAACIGATPLPLKLAEAFRKKCGTAAEVTLTVLTLGLLVLCMMNAAAVSYHPFIYFRF